MGGLIINLYLNRLEAQEHNSHFRASVLLLLIAFLFILAAEYACKDNPLSMVTTNGHRYTWIPYSLIFFSTALATYRKKIMFFLSFVVVMLISSKSIEVKQSSNLQFKSFVNFSNYKKVSIPIEPQYDSSVGWFINRDGQIDPTINTLKPHIVDLNMLKVMNDKRDVFHIYIPEITCNKSKDIGLEMEINQHKNGSIKIYWSEMKVFDERNSLRLFYPEGKNLVQFAFPSNKNINYLRVDLYNQYEINNISYYCLP